MEDSGQLVGLLLFLLALVVSAATFLLRREIRRYDRLRPRMSRAEMEIREIKRHVKMEPTIYPIDDVTEEESA